MLSQMKGLFVWLLLCVSLNAVAATKYNIVTGTENGTNVWIGRDLAKYVAGSADIDLQVLPSKGSVENIMRLRDEPGTKFALAQSDVYQAFNDQAAAGDPDAARIIKPLRVIAPLFDAEVYFIVRADSPLNSIHDIEGKKINIGPIGGGVAMTSTTLYRLMFGAAMPKENVFTFSKEEALTRLVKEKDIDVVVVTAGQPSALLTGMEPGVEKFFKLLKLDENNPATKRAMTVYKKSAIKAVNYPNWLKEDMPCLSVTTLLVTYDYNLKGTKDSMARFAKSLCENLPVLQKEGHSKWSQVSLKLPALGKGWSYYPPTEQQLAKCQPLKPKPVRSCSLQNKVLGLCTDE
ncbi:MAG TPA: TAXI family TRAP transporter solute-binding subunit [Burkholderiales bacterium]|nr:TAXI family TRAP transporter solute-binding subunit [Burkholderiales bacterium]